MAVMGIDKPSAMQAGVVRIGHFRVNRLGFGAMRITGQGVWGPPSDLHTAKQLLCRAIELDINFFDTAAAYGPGVSETLIQEMLYPYDGLMIATKGGMTRGGPGQWQADGAPEAIRKSCLESLERLNLKKITLFQLHWPDPNVPFLDSVRTLVDLQNEGLIRYIGLCNVSLEQLQQAMEIAEIVSVQNQYNLLHRQASDPIVRFCEQHDLAFIPYSPLGGETTTGPHNIVQAIASAHDATLRQILLAWLLARSPIMLPIPGTKLLKHLEENVAAASIKLSEEEFDRLNRLAD